MSYITTGFCILLMVASSFTIIIVTVSGHYSGRSGRFIPRFVSNPAPPALLLGGSVRGADPIVRGAQPQLQGSERCLGSEGVGHVQNHAIAQEVVATSG